MRVEVKIDPDKRAITSDQLERIRREVEAEPVTVRGHKWDAARGDVWRMEIAALSSKQLVWRTGDGEDVTMTAKEFANLVAEIKGTLSERIQLVEREVAAIRDSMDEVAVRSARKRLHSIVLKERGL